MGMKPRLRTWVAWFENHTSHLDDEPWKIKAHTYDEALRRALDMMDRTRFSLGCVLTLGEFHQQYPGWRRLV